MIKELRIVIVFMLLTLSCGVLKRGAIPWEAKPVSKTASKKSKSPASASVTVLKTPEKLSASGKEIKKKLDEAFRDWKGIPYVLGGSSYSGVDCSSFMQIVFEDYFGTKLPRTTTEQLKVGKSVKRNKIVIGDLIFFKTGRKTLHVGVAVSNGEFMHASTSSGVMISGIEERYWADAYLTTRRLF
tara:strand:+ start:4623 stop:5177 length:555 start_codon:yes stop_codon:yes gene_type:complete